MLEPTETDEESLQHTGAQDAVQSIRPGLQEGLYAKHGSEGICSPASVLTTGALKCVINTDVYNVCPDVMTSQYVRGYNFFSY